MALFSFSALGCLDAMALKDVRLCVRDVEAGEDRVLRERLSATFSLHFF